MLIAEAVAAGCHVQAQYAAAGIEPVEGAGPLHRLGRGVAERVSDTQTPTGLLAIVDIPPVAEDALANAALAVVIDGVADPGNLGTILRTADALGPAFVALSAASGDPTAPKAVRASAGAVFRVPVVPFEEATAGRVALVPREGTPLSDLTLPEPVTFLLGAERKGLPEDVLATCEATATIPQAEASESLNVAVAGAIALYEWRRRR